MKIDKLDNRLNLPAAWNVDFCNGDDSLETALSMLTLFKLAWKPIIKSLPLIVNI